MGRQKGCVKTGGRVKGSRNKVTEKTVKGLSDLVYSNLPKLQEEIDKLEGKDFVWAIDKISQYVIPKPTADVNVTADVKTTASVQYKKDMEVLDNIPADVIADIAEKLQMSMSKVSEETTEPDTADYDEDGED